MYSRYAILRDAKGLSDWQVAKESNVPYTTIHDWGIRAKNKKDAGISVNNLRKIANFFNVSLDYF